MDDSSTESFNEDEQKTCTIENYAQPESVFIKTEPFDGADEDEDYLESPSFAIEPEINIKTELNDAYTETVACHKVKFDNCTTVKSNESNVKFENDNQVEKILSDPLGVSTAQKDQPTITQCLSRNPRGKIVSSEQRLMAYNIFLKYLEKRFSKSQAVIRTALEVGIGKNLVWKIIAEMAKTGQVKEPANTKCRKSIFDTLKEDEKKAIKNTVHSFLERNEIPTLNKVLQVAQNDVTNIKSRKEQRYGPLHVKMRNLKNSGEEFVNKRGKGNIVLKKEIGPPCNCKLKCFEKVNEEHRKIIFENFWATGDYNIQNNYLYGCMTSNEVKRRRHGIESKRKQTIAYNIKLSNDNTVVLCHVCKSAFLSIHGLQNNRGRVENIIKKKVAKEVTALHDKRGKHENHARKYSKQEEDYVKKYIEMLLCYKGHYRQDNSSNTENISMEYSIQSIYRQYTVKCIEDQRRSVSNDKFRRIFTENFTIKFKTPCSDTCSESDSFAIQIKQAKLDKSEVE